MLTFVVHSTIFWATIFLAWNSIFSEYLKKAHLHALHFSSRPAAWYCVFATQILQMHSYIWKQASFLPCVFELWKLAMTFAIEQGCLFSFFLCVCIFFPVKYILVNLNDNQIIEAIRFLAFPELRTCTKINF